ALWRIGPAAAVAAPSLSSLVTAPKGDVIEQYVTVCALASVSGQDTAVTTRMLELLRDQHGDLRTAAAFALGRLSAGDEQVVDALTKAVEDKNPRVREAASTALRDLQGRRSMHAAR